MDHASFVCLHGPLMLILHFIRLSGDPICLFLNISFGQAASGPTSLQPHAAKQIVSFSQNHVIETWRYGGSSLSGKNQFGELGAGLDHDVDRVDRARVCVVGDVEIAAIKMTIG